MRIQNGSLKVKGVDLARKKEYPFVVQFLIFLLVVPFIAVLVFFFDPDEC